MKILGIDHVAIRIPVEGEEAIEYWRLSSYHDEESPLQGVICYETQHY